jgi:hypothetical protein
MQMNKITSPPPLNSLISPVSLVDLQPGMCACLVPVKPFPMYCGQPATHNFRMCEGHAKAYLITPEKQREKSKNPKR